jgi:hypothetical protein
MRIQSIALLMALIALAAPAQATYVGSLIDFTGGLNTVYATALAAAYNADKSPKEGYTWGTLQLGDIVVVILKATKIASPLTPVAGIPDSSYTGELTKYLAVQIAQIDGNMYKFQAGGTDSWDPFGKLKTGEVLGIWLETTKDFTVGHPISGSGSRSDDVGYATDGDLLATFGIAELGDFVGVYGSFGIPPQIVLSLGGGLKVMQNPLGLHWLGESVVPGGPKFDLALTSLSFGPVGEKPAGSVWDAFGADSEKFRVIPEPGTMTALLAMGGAAALGLALRRRKES